MIKHHFGATGLQRCDNVKQPDAAVLRCHLLLERAPRGRHPRSTMVG